MSSGAVSKCYGKVTKVSVEVSKCSGAVSKSLRAVMSLPEHL